MQTTTQEIYRPYTTKNLSEKRAGKVAFQKVLGLRAHEKTPLICVIGAFGEHADLSHVMNVGQGIIELGAQLIVICEPGTSLVDRLQHIARNERGNCSVYTGDERDMHRAVAASDILLMPSAASDKYPVYDTSFGYGTVPIAPVNDVRGDALVDYDPRTESGNSFMYLPDSSLSMFAAVVRAVETYKLPYDWRSIQRNGMELFGDTLPLDDDDSVEESEIFAHPN